MIAPEEKLRKVSDQVFQEANPPEGRNKPLEWRRDLNVLSFRLKNLRLVTSYTIHDKDFSWDEDAKREFSNLLKPNVVDHLEIDGLVDEEEMRDRLYILVKDKSDETLFSVNRVRSPLKVSMRVGEPTEQAEGRPAGLYWGNAFTLDHDPRDNGYQFELRVPQAQLLRLVETLRADSASFLQVQVLLLSFTFEVDDFFREPFDPRDIVVNDGAPCFSRWIGVTSRIGQHIVVAPLETDSIEPKDWSEQSKTPELQAQIELTRVLQSFAKPLNSIVTALWILAVGTALHFFFK
jgi:hypothetical protein